MFTPINAGGFCDFIEFKCKCDEDDPVKSVGGLPYSGINEVRTMADIYNNFCTNIARRIFRIQGDKQMRLGNLQFYGKDVETLGFAVTLLGVHEATENMMRSMLEENRRNNIMLNILSRAQSIQNIRMRINIE